MSDFPPRLRNQILMLLAWFVLGLALLGFVNRWTDPAFGFRLNRLQVVNVTAQDSPLLEGDVITHIDGKEAVRDFSARSQLAARGREGPVEVRVLRNGFLSEQTITGRAPSFRLRTELILSTLAAIAVMAIAIAVFRGRRDPQAALFLLLCLLLASLLSRQPRAVSQPWAFFLEWGQDLNSLFLPALFLHFLLLFPERRPRHAAVRTLIYLPPTILALLDIAALLGPGESRLLQGAANVMTLLLLAACLLVLLFKMFRRGHHRERRRLRLVMLGVGTGLMPLFVFQILYQVLPTHHFSLSGLTPVFLLIVPASFALSMMRRELLVLQRQALSLLRLVASGTGFALCFFMLRQLLLGKLSSAAAMGLRLPLEAVALAIVLACWYLLRRFLLEKSADRDKHHLSRTEHWVRTSPVCNRRDELSSALLPLLGEEMGARWIAWLDETDEGWHIRARWSADQGAMAKPPYGEAEITLPDKLQEMLTRAPKLFAAEQWDPYWAGTLLSSTTLEWCRGNDIALLLSLNTKDRSPSLIVFGTSADSQLYRSARLQRLQQFVPTLDLLLRNHSLLIRAKREEKLQTELQVARDIQRRLLPEVAPDIKGVEVDGRMISSREVGGDYYDYVSLFDGRLGLALGDATGSGVPAALLMSSVSQAFLEQAASGSQPDRVLADMNRSLLSGGHTTNAPGFLAAFTYALYDPEDQLLTYANGGLPPPWLLRRSGRLERLSRGGALLGLDRDARYHSGLLRLRPGDLLFLRSDGLEEQENENESLFGEKRLLQWLQKRQECSLGELCESLVEDLTRFSGGALTDDISFIFMRIAS